ncbi:MAG: hypothetical protein ABI628_01145 [Chloroflexota bacterium]
MTKRSKTRTEPSAEVEPRPDDGPVDDTVALGKVAGDQAASGLAQGLAWPLIVYAVARAIGAFGRYLRGGRRLR